MTKLRKAASRGSGGESFPQWLGHCKDPRGSKLGSPSGRPKWQIGYEQDIETGAGEASWVNGIWLWGRNGAFILGARECVLKR